MISTVVIAMTLLMAAGFTLVYLLSPSWRERVERPKQDFQQQIRRYDSQRQRLQEENS